MREARRKTAYDVDERKRERARREQETAEQSDSHTDEEGASQARRDKIIICHERFMTEHHKVDRLYK